LHFSVQRNLLLSLAGELLADLGQLTLLGLDVALSRAVVFLFALEALFVLLEVVLFAVELILEEAELLTRLVDELVTLARVLDGLLPLQVQLVTFLVQALELLGRFVELDLGSLGLGHLLL
jgi:signal transduction histidine kinase